MRSVGTGAATKVPLGHNIWLLTACQSLYYMCVSIDLTLTAIVGLSMAPNIALATLPLAMITIVGTAGSVLAGLATSRIGYPAVMIAGALSAVVGGALSGYAVVSGSFGLLCVGTGVVGLYRATGGYIRFMASDLAPEGHRERAISVILCGGLVAAFAGPWLATASSHFFSAEYAGSYLMVAVLSLLSVPLLLTLRPPRSGQAAAAADATARNAIAGQPLRPIPLSEAWHSRDFVTAVLTLGIAGAAMTMIMAIGPLGSEHAGHSAGAGASIIQWHLVGMFAPSLFSGALMRRWGRKRIAVIGAALLTGGAVAGSAGEGYLNFLAALALNGIGWNFLFVAGSAFLVACYPPGRGGRVQAVAEGVGSATSVLASLSASAIFYAIGWQGTNIPVSGLGVLLLLWFALTAGAQAVVRPAPADPADVSAAAAPPAVPAVRRHLDVDDS